MSMYEMLFPGAAPVLAHQTLRTMSIPEGNYRLRDTWIETDTNGELVVRIVTRLGGGNRADYAADIAELQDHPLYIRDHDESEWDKTYASFYFRLPADLPAEARTAFELAAEPRIINMKQRADGALADAKARWDRGEYTDAETRLAKKIADGTGGIIEI